jgi:hypothetical protein
MNCNNIILIILSIIILYLLCKIHTLEKKINQKEKFTQSSMTITESIKNLGLIAKKIQETKGDLVFPANVVIKGNLKVEGDSGIKAYREVSVYDNKNLTGDKIAVENKESDKTKIYSQKDIQISKNDANIIKLTDKKAYFTKSIFSFQNINALYNVVAGTKAVMKSVGSMAYFGDNEDSTFITADKENVKIIHGDKGSVIIQKDGESKKGRIQFSLMKPGITEGLKDDTRGCYRDQYKSSSGEKEKDILFTKMPDGVSPAFIVYKGSEVSRQFLKGEDDFYSYNDNWKCS